MSGKAIVNLILAAIFVVVLFLGYTFFIKKPSEDSLAPTNGITTAGFLAQDGEAGESSREFIEILEEINGIRFDQGIFENAEFLSLTDKSQPLPQKASGRPNPFAPFSGQPARSTNTDTGTPDAVLPFNSSNR